MTITLAISPVTENNIQEEAKRVGLPASDIVSKVLEERFSRESPKLAQDDWEILLRSLGTPGPTMPLEYTRREHLYEDHL